MFETTLDTRIARSLHARNPFYLLSALSMLTGCYALSRAIGLQPGLPAPLLWLMGVLQVYEFLLLGLAVYLFRRAGVPDDARMAFLLGLLFLVDTTYLNAELATSDPFAAPWVALAQLAFVAPKLILLRDALGLTSLRTLALTVSQIGLLLFLPGVFGAVQFMDGKVHALGLGREMLPLVVYGIWWLVGAIPVSYLWADLPSEHSPHPIARTVSRVSLYLPLASIVLHLFSLHWMYRLPFYGGYWTPMLLGVGTYLAYRMTSERYAVRAAFRWVAPIWALPFSLGYSEALVFSLGPVVVSPVRLGFVGIALVYLAHWRLGGKASFAWASGVVLGIACSGESLSAAWQNWRSLVPDTAMELGAAAILAAFAFLALAFAVSLWRPRVSPQMRSGG